MIEQQGGLQMAVAGIALHVRATRRRASDLSQKLVCPGTQAASADSVVAVYWLQVERFQKELMQL